MSVEDLSGGRVDLVTRVLDENLLPVMGAHVSLMHAQTGEILRGETDFRGQHEFQKLTRGEYRVEVGKEGYFVARENISLQDSQVLEVTLSYFKEISDEVDVIYAEPTIDPSATAGGETLDTLEILSIPYPTSRDIRNILPFLPGVIQNNDGQIHLNGSASNQILQTLDGFNIGQPMTGLLELRFSPDAVRRIEVLRSRYSAEYGKGSGGAIQFETHSGDDRFRASATNFLPTVQFRDGFDFETWTPRLNFSGPVRKGKAWFFTSLQGEYNLHLVDDLPDGLNESQNWRLNSLNKLQANLGAAHVLTTTVLTNTHRSNHYGLSSFQPIETTRDIENDVLLVSVKDQVYMGGALYEFGFAASSFNTTELPLGNSPFQLHPGGARGNFFREIHSRTGRLQSMASATFPAIQWQGRHEFKIGTDVHRIELDQSVMRRPIFIFGPSGTLTRETRFQDSTHVNRNNWEAGAFIQDRWNVSDRFLLELGFRVDWDEVIGDRLLSPRFAISYLLSEDADTKLTGGIGLFHDATILEMITRPAAGIRVDQVYATDGFSSAGTMLTTQFAVNENELEAPRSLNWSIGFERELPASIYLKTEFEQRRLSNGFTFLQRSLANNAQIIFDLGNTREDRYRSLRFDVTQTIKKEYKVFLSYTRSQARSNSVIGFDIDDVLFASQSGGRLGWDTPNRLLSWGWLPLPRNFRLAYTLDWRDGFPFSVVNAQQELVGSPNSYRFPDYFSLGLHVDRQIHFLGRRWLVRVGLNNITGHANAAAIDNNVDSQTFLSFGAIQGRSLVTQVRLLGRH